MASPDRRTAQVVVVGTGIAGLTFALKAARTGRILVITKKSRAESNTNYARGGLAAGLGPDDDPSLHMADTLAAGHGLSRPEVVDLVVREGPARVAELVEWGVRFHREGGTFSLGLEAGHSRRRILRAADRTGKEIERALLAAVAEHPDIEVLEHAMAVDLLVDRSRKRCVGMFAVDSQTGAPLILEAGATVLASGGLGQVYRYTTNPSIATGDGMAMAYRAGAQLANLEFIQFHPTALYPPGDPAFLLSEALRGEGAVLRRVDGSTFMQDYDPRDSLAPRDVVARAIHAELQRTGEEHVILDVSAIPPEVMEERFPGATEGCRARGVDLFGTGIPVVPAAHYACGGVVTDLWGRTTLAGLYAAGEVACTGVHGANRLASNSLLEAVVFSHRAAEAVASDGDLRGRAGLDDADVDVSMPPKAASDDRDTREARIASTRLRLRDLMWDDVGIVRSDTGLERARRIAGELFAREEAHWPPAVWTAEAIELRNLAQVALLIARSAAERKESRGLHFNRDHPDTDEVRFRRDTTLER